MGKGSAQEDLPRFKAIGATPIPIAPSSASELALAGLAYVKNPAR